ncbi:MAG: hypothetical protein CMD99_03275 [Gammaproteobacteria bacterium]|nr:hypothetical protein [Gammaproteobacteria bacterium]
MVLSRTKNLSSIALFLLITGCSNTEEQAIKALRDLGYQYEAASLWNFGSPRPGLMNEDDVDVALNAVLEIRAELEAVVAKFPDTNVAKDILSTHGAYTDGLSIQRIDAQVKYLQSEKALFQHRSKVLLNQEKKSVSRAFGFSFLEKSDTTCEKKSIDMFGVRDFLPHLHDSQLSHFFIKFDNIIDLLISVEESINDAFNILDTSNQHELGIELWDMRDNKSKLVYDNMLRLFVNGYVPDYLENPDGVEVIPAMIRLRNLSNKSMVRCSSKNNEDEFKIRVGNWLPPGRTYYLDAIGSERNQFPVYVLLHSYAGKYDETELTEPVVSGLNEKYGDAIAEDWSIDISQKSWITDEGVLIVLRFERDRDAARFSLTYIYLPTFIARYHEFLEAYLVSYKHVVDTMREATEQENEQRASEINTKL